MYRCESAVADLENAGWTYTAEPFYIGALELDGLFCRWTNPEASGGGNEQFFAWAPISQAHAEAVETALINEGWSVEETPEGKYIYYARPGEGEVVDDEGYGMTFLLVDGTVKLASTRQASQLIQWPRP